MGQELRHARRLPGRLLLRAAAVLAVLLPGRGGAAESFCATHDLPKELVTPAFTAPMAYSVAAVGGRLVLQAVGQVRPGETARLQAAIRGTPGLEEVALHSPGGAAAEGLEMGRAIRKAGLATRVRTGQACISACSMAFLGGVARTVEPGGLYGVHMFTATRNAELVLKVMTEMGKLSRLRSSARRSGIDPAAMDQLVAEAVGRTLAEWEQMAAKVAASRARYLVEMSTSLELMTDEFSQNADGVCFLGETGLRRYNVVNARGTPARDVPLATATQSGVSRRP